MKKFLLFTVWTVVVLWGWAYVSWFVDALGSEESLKQRSVEKAQQAGNLIGHKTVGSVEKLWCSFIKNSKKNDHCIQDAAVRANNPDRCDQIKAESFSDLEGPAPRDKCYMLIAGQTGDDSFCDRVEGGMISYSQEECYEAAAKYRK